MYNSENKNGRESKVEFGVFKNKFLLIIGDLKMVRYLLKNVY